MRPVQRGDRPRSGWLSPSHSHSELPRLRGRARGSEKQVNPTEPTGSAGRVTRVGDSPSGRDRSGPVGTASSPPSTTATTFWTCAQLKSKQAHDVTTCWGGDGIPLVILSVCRSFQLYLCLLHSSTGRDCTKVYPSLSVRTPLAPSTKVYVAFTKDSKATWHHAMAPREGGYTPRAEHGCAPKRAWIGSRMLTPNSYTP